MNINALRDDENDAGFWAAAAATDPAAAWTGAVLYRSTDGGTSYSSLASIPRESTMGFATNALGGFASGNIPDELSSVNVALIQGTLTSTDYAGLLAGTNAAIIGSEIVHFRDATLESDGTYTLRGFLRGRRGSEYAMAGHAVSERFVLVSFSNLARVPQAAADIGIERHYKPLAVGSTLAATTAQTFTNQGVGLKPYAPVQLGGGSDSIGNFTLKWVRRNRIAGDWANSVEVPNSETTESYVVEIYADSTFDTLIRTLSTVSAPTASYNYGEQISDFGAVQDVVYFKVYQLSSVLGRGHAAVGDTAGGSYASEFTPTVLAGEPPVLGVGGGGSGGGSSDPIADGPYPYGALPPTPTDADMLARIQTQYDDWKAHAIGDCPGVSGGKIVRFNSSLWITVSEGMGYGMLLAVLFAGHDSGAQALFDGLLTTVRARPARGVVRYYTPLGQYLMEWRLYPNGEGESNDADSWNAMDGDLDIAMALLMAHRQWGSGGTWNYLAEALNTIAALKSYNFKSDGTSMGLPNGDTSRTSDYMIGHFRAFAAATGDTWWTTTVIDRCYDLMELMQGTYSTAHLIPDFIMNTGGSPIPSTGGFGYGDGNFDANKYWYNACRIPWRLACDYVWSGDSRNLAINEQLIDFFEAEAAGDALSIQAGWNLDGSVAGTGNSAAFHGPILAGAVAVGNTTFADLMWDWNDSHEVVAYFDGELQLLSMVVASGNWWKP